MQGNKQNTFKSVVFGFAVLLAGQALTATVLISRNIPNVDAEIRVKAVVLVSAIALVGAFFAWYITSSTKKSASRQPGSRISRALAANFIRLIMPLLALVFLQSDSTEVYLSKPLQNFIRETLLTSYLVLLLLDILLHVTLFGRDNQAFKHYDNE